MATKTWIVGAGVALGLLVGCATEQSSPALEPVDSDEAALGAIDDAIDGGTLDKKGKVVKKKVKHKWADGKNWKKPKKPGKPHDKPQKPKLTCDHMKCPEGTHCELQGMACGKAALWKTPVCVPDDVPPPPTGPECGGIAGTTCPGSAQCVDDPTDKCDPKVGGRNCIGLCVCNAIGLCEPGYVWNSDPFVCDCVETMCPLIDCPEGTTCEMIAGEPVCVGDEPEPDSCAAVLCPVGHKCVEIEGMPTCVPFEGERCGDTVCAFGEVCCNESCGICTPPDGFCTQQVCAEED